MPALRGQSVHKDSNMPIVIEHGRVGGLMGLAQGVGDQKQRQQNFENTLRIRQQQQEQDRQAAAQEQRQREQAARDAYNQSLLTQKNEGNDIRWAGIDKDRDLAGMTDQRQRDLQQQRIDAEEDILGRKVAAGIATVAERGRLQLIRDTKAQEAAKGRVEMQQTGMNGRQAARLQQDSDMRKELQRVHDEEFDARNTRLANDEATKHEYNIRLEDMRESRRKADSLMRLRAANPYGEDPALDAQIKDAQTDMRAARERFTQLKERAAPAAAAQTTQPSTRPTTQPATMPSNAVGGLVQPQPAQQGAWVGPGGLTFTIEQIMARAAKLGTSDPRQVISRYGLRPAQ